MKSISVTAHLITELLNRRNANEMQIKSNYLKIGKWKRENAYHYPVKINQRNSSLHKPRFAKCFAGRKRPKNAQSCQYLGAKVPVQNINM